MKCIFIHGISQSPSSWDSVVSHLQSEASVEAICLDLWSVLDGKEATYKNIYAAFAKQLNTHSAGSKINLCGLSFGGMLALNYAIDFPQNVMSIVTVGSQCRVPKNGAWIQKLLMKLMPASAYKNMGIGKKDMASLMQSMADIDFSRRLSEISCPALILYGEKDRPMYKNAAEYLAKNIPGAQLATIENAGHAVNTDNPAVLARAISDFLP